MKNTLARILTKRDGGKLSQYIACLTAALAIFIVGLHTGWPLPSLNKLMSDEYPFDVTEDEASIITIIAYVGHVVGGISGSILIDIIGRKWTILIMSVAKTIAFIFIYWSSKAHALLYCARIAGGIGEGALMAVVPVYIAEVSDPDVRGKLGSLTTLFAVLGILFINVVGSYPSIHNTALICLIFPIIFWSLFYFMPETPYYLLMRHQRAQAIEAVKWLKRSDKVEKEVEVLEGDITRQMSERGTFKDLFVNKTNRKVFVLLTCTRIIQQFTGCTAFNSYFQILIAKSTSVSPVLGSSSLLIVQVTFLIFSSFLIDRLGRKPLLISSLGCVSFVLVLFASFITLRDYTSIDVSQLDWLPILFLFLYMVSFSIGIGPMVNILVSEMYSNSIKSKGVAMGCIFFASSMMASTKYYQFTADHISLAVPFFTFALCSFLGMLFIHFFLPETKGRTLDEIQIELRGYN